MIMNDQEEISYESIRSKKLEEYGTEFKNWIWILVNQYKDRTHFLFELLQNAEDSGASDVKLELYKDKLIIEHNGELFSKNDVISITKVADSTKNNGKDGAIGKFGIGFKSVYVYTSTPRIYSGIYSFEIQDFIYPYEIERKNINREITKIEIPFNSSNVTKEDAFLSIRKALFEQIKDDTLLFLNNINKITICIEGNNDKIQIERQDKFRKDGGENFIDAKLIYSRGIKHSEKEYLIVTDNEIDAVKLAFAIEEGRVIAESNTSIFTFFPTDKESHQSFYIHAPFETTPARDNIVEDSKKNLKLVDNICECIQYAFEYMKDCGLLTIESINLIYPIYEYGKDTIFHAIYECAIDMIASGKEIIPTNHSGVFKNKDSILLAENKSIVDCFNDTDIQSLFNNHRIYWIAKQISTDAYQEFRNFLKKNFELKTYTWKDVILKLNETFLERKEKSWFEKLFSSIRTFAYVSSKTVGSHDIDVSSIPFVRLSTGKQVCGVDENNMMTVYLNNPEGCENRIEYSFLESDIISDFYEKNLRIPNYNVERIVIDEILPKYQTRYSKVKTNDLKENITDLKLIKDALITAPSLIESIREAYIITDGENWFQPEELHVPSGYNHTIPEYRLVKDIIPLKFVSMDYQYEPKLDDKFFVQIGCAATLKQQSIDKNLYLSMVQKYLGKEECDNLRYKVLSKSYFRGIQWNMVFEGFPTILETIDQRKSREVARFLNCHTAQFEIRGEIVGANDQNFSGQNVDNMKAYSAIGMMLAYIPWMYTKEDVPRKVAPIEIRRQDLDPVYEKEARRLLDMLPFKEEDKAIEAILSRIDNPQNRETMKELLTNADRLEQVTKAIQKQKIKELKAQEKKKTPQEILEEMAKRQGKISSKGKLEDAEPIKNLEKRKEKLEKEFGESMDFRINVPQSTLKYTYADRLSVEEKTFLEMQYEGICQICNTTIERYDNKRHFQAINVMKTSELDEKYLGKLELGWNSLCLCPNCAAKYRYGIKDMSDFYEQVMQNEVEEKSYDFVEIRIGLQGESEIIKYSPKHFLALKVALETFKKK